MFLTFILTIIFIINRVFFRLSRQSSDLLLIRWFESFLRLKTSLGFSQWWRPMILLTPSFSAFFIALSLPGPLRLCQKKEEGEECDNYPFPHTANQIIKLMLESSLNKSIPRISDKLEDIYSDESYRYRAEEQLRKRLYSQIIQKSQERIKEKRQLEHSLEKRENHGNDLFWRNEEERRKAMSRDRKRKIDEARQVNNSQLHQHIQKATEDPYHLQKSFRDDMSSFIANEQRKKEQRERFLKEGMALQDARQGKKRFQKELEVMIDHKKEAESNELQNRRADFYSQWKSDHFTQKHPSNRQLFDQINRQRQYQQAKLQQLIAVKGGLQLNQRMAAQRASLMDQQQQRKQEHVNLLKQQVEDNTYKSAIDRYLQLNYQRARMEEMNKALNERDQVEREQKKQANNEHLKVLRGQIKPRNLMPEPDKIEFAGIGSPAHIGKIVHDDRLRQLKWIERNFLREAGSL